MRLWRSIGSLWMLLAWLVVSSPSAYAENVAAVRNFYPSSLERSEKKEPLQEEALAARTRSPYLARFTRERASGSGDYTPPAVSQLNRVFTAFYPDPVLARPRFFEAVVLPQKTGNPSTGSRAPPFLH